MRVVIRNISHSPKKDCPIQNNALTVLESVGFILRKAMQIKNRVSGRGNLFAGLIFMRCGSLQIHTAYFLGEYRAESLRSCCFIRGKTHIYVAIHCRACFCPLSLPLYCKRRSSSPPASPFGKGRWCVAPEGIRKLVFDKESRKMEQAGQRRRRFFVGNRTDNPSVSCADSSLCTRESKRKPPLMVKR